MGLEMVGLPDVVDGGLADSLVFGHGAATPMGHSLGLGLQGGLDNGADLVAVIVGLAPASGGDFPESVESLLGKACSDS